MILPCRTAFITLMLLTAIAGPLRASDAGPMPTLKARVDEFIRIMDDPAFQDEARRDRQRAEMWEIIRRTIFFKGVARLAVGKDWPKFTPEEKNEFTDAFAEMLAVNYLRVVQEGYRKDRLEYLGEKLLTDRKAVVHTRVLRQGQQIPVDVKMAKVDDQWRIYDVLVEGVSLVKNYRAQFGAILMNESPAQLIGRIHKKIEEGQKDEPLELKP